VRRLTSAQDDKQNNECV